MMGLLLPSPSLLSLARADSLASPPRNAARRSAGEHNVCSLSLTFSPAFPEKTHGF